VVIRTRSSPGRRSDRQPVSTSSPSWAAPRPTLATGARRRFAPQAITNRGPAGPPVSAQFLHERLAALDGRASESGSGCRAIPLAPGGPPPSSPAVPPGKATPQSQIRTLRGCGGWPPRTVPCSPTETLRPGAGGRHRSTRPLPDANARMREVSPDRTPAAARSAARTRHLAPDRAAIRRGEESTAT